MTLTSDLLADLQADLGVSDDESVFTDAALNRLYIRAGTDYNLTVVLALRQLLASATKLSDYTQNESSEKLSQVYKHLSELLTRYEKLAGVSGVSVSFKSIDLDIIEDDTYVTY